MIRLLALLLALPPEPASHVAALAVGRPSIADELVRVCRRESRCRAIGEHDLDAHLSHASWSWQVHRGAVLPWCQPLAQGWATRGIDGLNAAVHVAVYMPPCTPAWVFDFPIVSAVVSAMKLERECSGRRRSGWCPRRSA